MMSSGRRRRLRAWRWRDAAWAGLLAALASGVAIARDRMPVDDRAQANLRYLLDVAAADGDDPVADFLLARRLGWTVDGFVPDPGDAEAAAAWDLLRARAQVVRRELEARVAAARDEDPLLLALEAHCPDEVEAARCADARVRLAHLAGDNAAHHLRLAAIAWREGDAEGFLRDMRRAGAATHYDDGFRRIFGALHRRLRSVPHPGAIDAGGRRMHSAAAVDALAQAITTTLPWGGIVAPCQASEGELRQGCHQVARQLMQSQTLIDVSVSRSLLETLGTPAEQAEAEARYQRGLWWQMAVSQRDPDLVDPRYREDFRRYFIDLAAYGELAALERLVERLGLSPEPPAGWTVESHLDALRGQHEATSPP